MITILNLFQSGLIAIITLPYWIVVFVYYALKAIVSYVIFLIKMPFLFFSGAGIFTTKEDVMIAKIKLVEEKKQQDSIAEVLNDVER